MSKQSDAAWALFDLLAEYVDVLDHWQDHFVAIVDKQLKSKAAQKEHQDEVQAKYVAPLMDKCAAQGFRYPDLMLMIAPAFETSYKDRREQLDWFEGWVKEKYGV